MCTLPRDSMGCFSHNYFHSLCLSYHTSTYIPIPSHSPAPLEIQCGTDRKISCLPPNARRDVYHGSAVVLSPVSDELKYSTLAVSLHVFQSVAFRRQKTCLTSSHACPLGEDIRKQAFEHCLAHLPPDSLTCKIVRRQSTSKEDQNRKDKKRGLRSTIYL